LESRSPHRKVLVLSGDESPLPSSSSPPRTGRQVGYAICEATDPRDRRTAIVWFYPMSGHSLIVESAAQSFAARKYRASVVSVDRPSVGDTSALTLLRGDDGDAQSEKSLRRKADRRGGFSLDRIRGHADDVLAVLKHHKIERVYLLGVCLGHVYAVQVARQLFQQGKSDDDTGAGGNEIPRLEGLTLVAPFVSPACPRSWRVARLGARVPPLVLVASTNALVSLGGWLLPAVLTPARVRKLISPQERYDFGWEDEDFDDAVVRILQMSQLTSNARATEAQLGADPSWQQICDNFAVESGIGLVPDDDDINVPDGGGENGSSSATADAKEVGIENRGAIPVVIHACREDRVSTLESVKWIARRCYGEGRTTAPRPSPSSSTQPPPPSRSVLKFQERIRTHEHMTMLGGPPRNPNLLHEIAEAWGLC